MSTARCVVAWRIDVGPAAPRAGRRSRSSAWSRSARAVLDAAGLGLAEGLGDDGRAVVRGIGEPRLEGDDGEAELADEQAHQPVAQRAGLRDVVVVLAQCHHPRVADELGHAGQALIRRAADDVVGKRHRTTVTSPATGGTVGASAASKGVS